MREREREGSHKLGRGTERRGERIPIKLCANSVELEQGSISQTRRS